MNLKEVYNTLGWGCKLLSENCEKEKGIFSEVYSSISSNFFSKARGDCPQKYNVIMTEPDKMKEKVIKDLTSKATPCIKKTCEEIGINLEKIISDAFDETF